MTPQDDYSLSRVPAKARYGWGWVAVQQFGQISDLITFSTGVILGAGLSFWGAFWALTLGSVVLELVAVFVGIAGCREGLSTSVLTRWTGFGRYGSALLGLIISISLIGWFGIQNGVFALGMNAIAPVLDPWVWSLITGVVITVFVMYGFRAMRWVAVAAVPAFQIVIAYSVITEFAKVDVGALFSAGPLGEPMTIAAGATLVAGSYMAGATIMPDMNRFNRNARDVVKQSVLSITLGQYVMGLIGVLLAYAVKGQDAVAILTSTVGVIGVITLVAAVVKINDWNLYSSSLGIVNAIDTLTGVKVNRVWATLIIGIAGTTLSAAGILDRFVDFLMILGVTLPPIAGIVVAEYYIVKRWRGELDESRQRGVLPATEPTLIPVTLVIWAVSAWFGWWSEREALGIGSLNSLLLAGLLYLTAGKLGLVRAISEVPVADDPKGKEEACESAST
ncbi:cytosine permease [Kibdelosporangium persicum]|uniref:Permease for cytosine/purines uracil thiamine allantoin n=1 Tax=Kibdelosporangium persicum TaxID=2698649 RepID=A0ABX2F3F8_9PSEU|nr:cytosine permease [Kibdelosporangium persicum]NRN65859.1 Permease for cytosine/purines uracil thiamine allantoin [Kibdelosporangium persicum]